MDIEKKQKKQERTSQILKPDKYLTITQICLILLMTSLL